MTQSLSHSPPQMLVISLYNFGKRERSPQEEFRALKSHTTNDVSESGSYFREKKFSGFPSDVLQLFLDWM